MLPIEKDTFVGAESEERFRGLLYDLLDYKTECSEKRAELCHERFNKLEKRGLFEKITIAVVGAIAAIFAWFKA